MQKEKRIEQIKEKTFDLIGISGSMDSLRTKDIANAIGASEATMFKYFDSKTDILETVIRDYIEKTGQFLPSWKALKKETENTRR